MNEISLPYHLIIPSVLSILILGIVLFKSKRLFKTGKWKWFWISFTIFFLFYLVIVTGATYSDIYAHWNLNRFDLNKDGFFNGDEITTEQKTAIKNLTNDIGRNFSFITGLFFSAILAFVVFIIGKTTEYIKNKKHTSNEIQ